MSEVDGSEAGVRARLDALGSVSYQAALPEGRIWWTNEAGQQIAHGQCKAVLSWADSNQSIMWAQAIQGFEQAGVPCLPAPEPAYVQDVSRSEAWAIASAATMQAGADFLYASPAGSGVLFLAVFSFQEGDAAQVEDLGSKRAEGARTFAAGMLSRLAGFIEDTERLTEPGRQAEFVTLLANFGASLEQQIALNEGDEVCGSLETLRGTVEGWKTRLVDELESVLGELSKAAASWAQQSSSSGPARSYPWSDADLIAIAKQLWYICGHNNERAATRSWVPDALASCKQIGVLLELLEKEKIGYEGYSGPPEKISYSNGEQEQRCVDIANQLYELILSARTVGASTCTEPSQLGDYLWSTVANPQETHELNKIVEPAGIYIMALGDVLHQTYDHPLEWAADWRRVAAGMVNLRALYLFGNGLEFHDIGVDLRTFPKLSLLDLADNQLIALPPDLCGCQQLEWLDLNRNSISAIPESIRELKRLRFLRVTNNPMSEQQVAQLREWLPSCEIVT